MIALNKFNKITREIDEPLLIFILNFKAAYRKVEEAGETVPETH